MWVGRLKLPPSLHWGTVLMGKLGRWGLGARMGRHTSEQNCLLGPLARLSGKELQPPTRET